MKTASSQISEKPILEQLAKYMKARRKQLKMSQAKLAQLALGNSDQQSAISDIERLKADGITSGTMQSILDALNSDLVFVNNEEKTADQIEVEIKKAKSKKRKAPPRKRPQKKKVNTLEREDTEPKTKIKDVELCDCDDPIHIPTSKNCLTCRKPYKQ